MADGSCLWPKVARLLLFDVEMHSAHAPYHGCSPPAYPSVSMALMQLSSNTRSTPQQISSLKHSVSPVECLQLSSIGVPNEETHRRALRELLFTAPGVENHISGVVRQPFGHDITPGLLHACMILRCAPSCL